MTALGALLREDALFTMPPEPACVRGRDAIIACWAPVMAGPEAWGDWRVLPTRANRQPAAANYLQRPGESEYRPVSLDVLRIEDGLIAEVTTFPADMFPAFALPSTL